MQNGIDSTGSCDRDEYIISKLLQWLHRPASVTASRGGGGVCKLFPSKLFTTMNREKVGKKFSKKNFSNNHEFTVRFEAELEGKV